MRKDSLNPTAKSYAVGLFEEGATSAAKSTVNSLPKQTAAAGAAGVSSVGGAAQPKTQTVKTQPVKTQPVTVTQPKVEPVRSATAAQPKQEVPKAVLAPETVAATQPKTETVRSATAAQPKQEVPKATLAPETVAATQPKTETVKSVPVNQPKQEVPKAALAPETVAATQPKTETVKSVPVNQPKQEVPKAVLAPETVAVTQPKTETVKSVPVNQPKQEVPKAALAPELAGEAPLPQPHPAQTSSALQAGVDLTGLSEEIEEFRGYLENARRIQDQIASFNPYAYATTEEAVAAEKSLKAQLARLTQPWGSMARMEEAFSTMEQFYNTAKREQKWTQLAGVVNNPDFEEMSHPPETDDDWYDTQRDIYGRYANMTEEEKKIFHYHFNTGGEEMAESYYISISNLLNYRQAEKEFQSFQGNTLSEMAYGSRVGFERVLDGVEGAWNAVTGNDEYIPTSPTQYLSDMVREDLADNGPKFLGSSLGQWGYDLAYSAGNMAPALVAGTVNPLLGAALGGVDAAGNAYTEMINEGYSKSQAGNYAALIGCSEAGLSYLLGGIGKLGGKFTDDVLNKLVDKVDNILGKVAIKLGGKVLAEVGEENLQAILGPWYKELTTHIKQERPNWEEFAYNSLLTAITTVLLEGKGAVKSAKTSANASNIGKIGWDGRAVVKDATGKSINMDGKKYEFLGYDEKGSPVYQDAEVLKAEHKAEAVAKSETEDEETAKTEESRKGETEPEQRVDRKVDQEDVAKFLNDGKIDTDKNGARFNGTLPKEKLIKYSLDPMKCPDKAEAFRKALGYDLNNYEDLMLNIKENIDTRKFVEKGDLGHGMRYEHIMKLKGPNGKSANVLTAWIRDGEGLRLTSVYVTEKEATK